MFLDKEMIFSQFNDELSHAIIKQITDEAEQITKDEEQKVIEFLQQKLKGDAKYHSNLSSHTTTLNSYSLATLFLSDKFYNKLGTGKFSGHLLLNWNGPDNFVFISDTKNPFSYTRHDGKIIKPNLMYTDGGSIPRILRGLKKFSSWGYAPAFIIHDWLYTNKKCNKSTIWSFEETALIMAEAMKTLMEIGYSTYDGQIIKLQKSEDTLYVMYQAVSSFIARNLWNDDESVDCI